MDIINKLTPKDTEEVKPNLFIKRFGDNKYRLVYPAAWNGKIKWKNLLLGGDEWLKHLIFFAILMLIVYGYIHDNKALIEQQQLIAKDPFAFCNNITSFKLQDQRVNFSSPDGYSNLIIDNGKRSANSLSDIQE
jgi:hypothetical protein